MEGTWRVLGGARVASGTEQARHTGREERGREHGQGEMRRGRTKGGGRECIEDSQGLGDVWRTTEPLLRVKGEVATQGSAILTRSPGILMAGETRKVELQKHGNSLLWRERSWWEPDGEQWRKPRCDE